MISQLDHYALLLIIQKTWCIQLWHFLSFLYLSTTHVYPSLDLTAKHCFRQYYWNPRPYLPRCANKYLCEHIGPLTAARIGQNISQRTLTYFVKGCITVQLTSCLTGLDSTKLVNLYLVQHKQSSWIQTNKTGGQLYITYLPLRKQVSVLCPLPAPTSK